MTMRPTIVLGAGAFHVESVFRVFEPELQNFGYQTRPYALASIEKPGLVASDEIASLHALFYELIEVEGRDIVVYFHSYAGFSGSGAIAGWSKIEREAIGRKGGIVGLIYQAAFVPVGDVSMFKIAGPQWDMWYAPNEETGLVHPRGDSVTRFYHDVNPSLANEAVSSLRAQSLATMMTPVDSVDYGNKVWNGRRAYIRCDQDRTVLPKFQDMFMQFSGATWNVKNIDSGHSPFLSKPQELAGIVDSIIEGFEATY